MTGSTRGIGRAIAARFAAEGAHVAVTGRSRDAGEALAMQLRADGGSAIYVPLDVGDEASVAGAFEATEAAFGPPTILVNNAAPTDLMSAKVDAAVTEMTTGNWERLLHLGLTSVFLCCRHALKRMMRQRRGALVNISSLASLRSVRGLDAYTASKGAINALTRSIAAEYAEFGIRCNTIVVGNVDVGTSAPSRNDPAKAEFFRAFQLTRPGRPEDIASAALFLASREAEFITGQELIVDGGAAIKTVLPWITAPPRPD
ncbi:MAG: SDR family NAD(P)-dependent oxidoreductase [Gammaproteobacteria bacterium]